MTENKLRSSDRRNWSVLIWFLLPSVAAPQLCVGCSLQTCGLRHRLHSLRVVPSGLILPPAFVTISVVKTQRQGLMKRFVLYQLSYTPGWSV